jgi:hypothetical protein
MRFLIIFILLTSLVCADYEVRSYSTSDSLQISTSGAYTLYGSTTVANPGVAAGGGYTLSSGFLNAEAGCTVQLTDLVNFALAWLTTGSSPADLNSDSTVNTADFANLARYWLDNCPPGWPLK